MRFCVINLAWDRTYHQKTNYCLVICSYVGSHTSFQNLWHDKQPQKLKTKLNYFINDMVWQNIIKGIFLCKTFWLYARLLEECNGLSTSKLNYTYSKIILYVLKKTYRGIFNLQSKMAVNTKDKNSRYFRCFLFEH